MAEEMSELLLNEEDLDKLANDYPWLDFSFEDDYREEVRIMREAQLAKVLKAQGGTDAISWGKGVEDGIKRERERIQVWGPEPCPHFDAYEKRECSLCWEDLFKGES